MCFVPNTSCDACYVSLGNFSAGEMCVLGLGSCDAGRVVFSSEIFSAGMSCVLWGFCRVLCHVGGRVAGLLRLVEAMPLFERLGHTVLATLVVAMTFFQRFGHTVLVTLRDLAPTLYPVQGVFFKVSKLVLQGAGESALAEQGAVVEAVDPWAHWRPGQSNPWLRWQPGALPVVPEDQVLGQDPEDPEFEWVAIEDPETELFYSLLARLENVEVDSASVAGFEIYFSSGVLAEVPFPEQLEPFKKGEDFDERVGWAGCVEGGAWGVSGRMARADRAQ